MPLTLYSDDIPTTGTSGTVGELAMYAGQSVGLITGIEPAHDIVARLAGKPATSSRPQR